MNTNAQFSRNSERLLFETIGNENTDYITLAKLRETHVMFLEKQIPEIEQHFLWLLNSVAGNDHNPLAACFRKFDDLRRNLTDHIEMEERYVYPLINKGESLSCNGTAAHFALHHEDHEGMLRQLITEITHDLKNLADRMEYRMLVLKLRSLNEQLQLHGEIEDQLFSQNIDL